MSKFASGLPSQKFEVIVSILYEKHTVAHSIASVKLIDSLALKHRKIDYHLCSDLTVFSKKMTENLLK